MKKAIALGASAVVMSVLAINSVFAQTATPSPTMSSTTVTPSPTGSVQGATVPSGAPNTGFGGAN